MESALKPRGEVTKERPSRLQQVVAARMSDAHVTVPDFILNAEFDAGPLVELRASLSELGEKPIPTVNDLVVHACARALVEHPRMNGAYDDGSFELYERVNIGVVVATDKGVMVPTVFDADRKTPARIAAETSDLAERARLGGLTLDEVDGGTFTVSNLGMYGVSSFVPIINAPQAAILGVGTILERDGRPTITLTFVGDHRIVNGAEGARFLQDVGLRLGKPDC
jgi:pyruvate dehydrogenase E2 component (dihydrolipoamide acetyltransferase)